MASMPKQTTDDKKTIVAGNLVGSCLQDTREQRNRKRHYL